MFAPRPLRSLLLTSLFCLSLGMGPAPAATIEEDASRAFVDSDFDWLLRQPMQSKSGDPAALLEVFKFFQADHERAPLALQAYIKRYPNDPGAFDLAGTILLRKKDNANAAISFRKATQLDPKNSWTWAKLGAALVLNGQSDLATDALDRSIALDADNPLARRYLAMVSVQRGNLPEAILHSERALRAFGLPEATVNQAHFDLAELYRQANRSSSILDLLGPAVRNNRLDLPDGVKMELYGRYLDAAISNGAPKLGRIAMNRLQAMSAADHPLMQLSEARLLRLEGDAAGALAKLRAITASHPEMTSQLRGDMAQFLESAGDVDAAVAELRTAADEAGPEHDIGFLREATNVLIRAGQPEKAMDMAATWSGQAADRADLAILEAQVNAFTGHSQGAIDRLSALLDKDPENLEAMYLQATYRAATGDRDGAVALLDRLLAINPRQPQVWLTLAGTVHGHNSYTQAHGAADVSHGEVEALLKRAIAANPESADLNSELGLMYLSDGRVPEAISAFNAAVKASPAHIAGLSLGALARADIGEDLDTARALMERANTLAPDEPINQDILGWVMVRQGEVEPGMALLRKASEAEPEDVTIRYHLGVALMDQGKLDEARPELLASLAGPNYAHNVSDARARILRAFPATEVVAPVHGIDSFGLRDEMGTLTLRQIDGGLEIAADVSGLPVGENGLHIHQMPNCGPDATGKPGGLAGPHYGMADHDHGGHDHAAAAPAEPADHDHSAHDHSAEAAAPEPAEHDHGSHDHGAEPAMAAALPAGDFPALTADGSGRSQSVLTKAGLTLDEVRARAILIHEGPDVDGKSGKPIACAIVP